MEGDGEDGGGVVEAARVAGDFGRAAGGVAGARLTTLSYSGEHRRTNSSHSNAAAILLVFDIETDLLMKKLNPNHGDIEDAGKLA